jgi:hypothetical protein
MVSHGLQIPFTQIGEPTLMPPCVPGDRISAHRTLVAASSGDEGEWVKTCLQTLTLLRNHELGPALKASESRLQDYMAALKEVLLRGAPQVKAVAILQKLTDNLSEIEDWSTEDLWVLIKILRYEQPSCGASLVPEGAADGDLAREEGLRREEGRRRVSLTLGVISQLLSRRMDDLIADGLLVALVPLLREVQGEDETLSSIVAILTEVAHKCNAYQYYHLTRTLPALLSAVFSAKGASFEGSAPSSDRTSRQVVADATLDLYLLLLRRTLGLPRVARESLLNLSQLSDSVADRLVAGLLHRFDTTKDREVGAVLSALLSSGDEHSWELLTSEAAAMREPRFLHGASAAVSDTPAPTEEEVAREVMTILASSRAASWVDFCDRPCWGLWRAERWEEALYGALLDGDGVAVVRILAEPSRWIFIERAACFTSRRGPWREMLGPHVPCTISQALEAMAASPSCPDNVDRVRHNLRSLEAMRVAKGARASPALPSTSPMPRCYEKADFTLGIFEVENGPVSAMFGFRSGDRVRSKRFLSSYGTVVGLAENKLWVHWDADAGTIDLRELARACFPWRILE